MLWVTVLYCLLHLCQSQSYNSYYPGYYRPQQDYSDIELQYVQDPGYRRRQELNSSETYRQLVPDAPQGPGGRLVEDIPRFSQQDIRGLLDQINGQASEQCTRHVLAQWNYETDANPTTQLQALRSQDEDARFQRALWDISRRIRAGPGTPEYLSRQVRLLSVIGPAALPPELLDRYNRLIRDMLAVYESTTICAHNDPFRCSLVLDPDLVVIMGRSRDWDELQHVWLEWRRKTGMKLRDLYEQLVDLTNQAAHLNNLTDAASYWTFPYESPTFRIDVDDAWQQVKPLYDQLHAYVRRKLRDFYGPEKINRQAPLPAHILGNMWGQSWSNILDITIPYPGKNFLNVGPELIAQGYRPETLFRLADDFYRSLNMSAMPPEFWAGSIFEELIGQSMICTPSAWDFCNGKDYRIKMCAQVTMSDLVTAHHEMGHIQYFLEYRHLPKVFRDAANPGLHEAVGDAVALSVATPQHLQTLGLLKTSVDELPYNINFLFNMALDKVAFLPYSYVLDRWRWDIFEGGVPKSRYNCHYWYLREQISGIKPPLLRSEIDFDPGAKYHVLANVPYIKYFVAIIVQFQLHRAMCIAAGQFDPARPDSRPLHKCDIYRSPEAGQVLRRLMQAGASVPWQEALFRATGEDKLDGTALRDYFRPLEDWLFNENQRTQEFVGWLYDGTYCKSSIETANLEVRGGFYNAAPNLPRPNELFIFILILTLTIHNWR